LEKAYALLGIHNLASVPEIEKAYRYKKRLYELSRFVEGSPDWQFACARNEAIDEAYRYVKRAASDIADDPLGVVPLKIASLNAASGSVVHIPRQRRSAQSGGWSALFPRGEIWGLAVIFPLAVYVMQLANPTIIYELAPRWLRGSAMFLSIVLLFLGYVFPLLARFVFLKRPVRNFAGMLFLFPFTMLSADLFTSVLLRFSTLPGSGAAYVPAFYLLGLAPLFVLLHAHCAILKMSSPEKAEKKQADTPAVRRIAAYTFTLALSVGLSLFLSAAFN